MRDGPEGKAAGEAESDSAPEAAVAEDGSLLRFTVLGCGSSGGVPRIGADGPQWGDCDPAEPRNRRRRCSLLIERIGTGGKTRVLIDAGPDVREQLIDAGAGDLDAVIFTHDHADHCHGIDDLRMVFFNRRRRLPAYMDTDTERTLDRRFGYIFETPEGSSYPPILDKRMIEGTVVVEGEGGSLACQPFAVPHGRAMALGFRIGPLVYVPDISEMTNEAWAMLQGAEVWVIDALRYRPHPSHANVETALGWVARSGVPRAYLTNLHVDLDYQMLDAATPTHVSPAFDGLVLDFPA
ncbi:MAG: MBL fold metallo-hydrolase [Pseudomonadota bacterium]